MFIAESPVMLQKMEIVRQLAGTGSPILLLGEVGVGKELVARQIHKESKQRENAFIHINCVNDTLNITGNCQNGTLFLDEISELSLTLQEELLMLLERKTALAKQGMGYLRIVASTKGDLEKMVEEKKFIRELYFQLSILPVFIPPLRQRVEDILPLASYFLHLYEADLKYHFDGFSEGALDAMRKAYWKNNARELKNSIERACFNTRGGIIDEDALFLDPQYKQGRGAVVECDLKTALDAFKSSFVAQILEQCDWNQTITAKKLGIQRTYLSKLIKDLRITRNGWRG